MYIGVGGGWWWRCRRLKTRWKQCSRELEFMVSVVAVTTGRKEYGTRFTTKMTPWKWSSLALIEPKCAYFNQKWFRWHHGNEAIRDAFKIEFDDEYMVSFFEFFHFFTNQNQNDIYEAKTPVCLSKIGHTIFGDDGTSVCLYQAKTITHSNFDHPEVKSTIWILTHHLKNRWWRRWWRCHHRRRRQRRRCRILII